MRLRDFGERLLVTGFKVEDLVTHDAKLGLGTGEGDAIDGGVEAEQQLALLDLFVVAHLDRLDNTGYIGGNADNIRLDIGVIGRHDLTAGRVDIATRNQNQWQQCKKDRALQIAGACRPGSRHRRRLRCDVRWRSRFECRIALFHHRVVGRHSELAGMRREGEPSAMIFLFVLDRRLACVDQICLHKGQGADEVFAVGVRDIRKGFGAGRFSASRGWKRVTDGFPPAGTAARTAVSRMSPALDQAPFLQLVQNANKRNRFDFEDFRKTSLMDSLVLREVGQRLPL